MRIIFAEIWPAFLSAAWLIAAAPNKPIVADDPLAAAANVVAIQTATGRLVLPAGVVSVDAGPVLTGPNSGLTLAGPATIRNIRYTGDWFADSALAVRPGADGTAALSWRGWERCHATRSTSRGWYNEW